MGKFTIVSQDVFSELQLDAGVLLSTFDPANPRAPRDEEIITATTGGIEVKLEPQYSDFGDDIDNCPLNMMELKHLDQWAASMSFTALETSAEIIKLSLGAAEITNTAIYDRVKPRRDLEQTDFSTVWWVGDRVDGGAVAIEMINTLSTGGFGLKTTKNGKGQLSVTITGHVSMSAQNVVPMTFYSIEPDSN